jgi:hypothetical protein
VSIKTLKIVDALPSLDLAQSSGESSERCP